MSKRSIPIRSGEWVGHNAMPRRFVTPMGSLPQESPHFVNGLTSRLFGPHKRRTEGPKVAH